MSTSNIFKTTLLLGALTGLFLLVGNLLGGTGGMVIAFIFAVVLNMGAWWFSGSIALRMSGAQEVDPQQAPELHRMVERLAANGNMPKPRVYVIDSPMPNAFATGRDPQNGAVAVTTGIMQILSPRELEGVLAHELAHIKNRDTLISSIAATIAGAVTMLADMATWALIFGGFGGSDEEEGGGAAGMVGGLFMLILAPIAALLIQLAISRSREYGADAGGAALMGDGEPLARALEKLELWRQNGAGLVQVNPATAHQYIVNPLAGGIGGLFSTHPDSQERIRRLRALSTIELQRA
jgi:heat shock protein HtpX